MSFYGELEVSIPRMVPHPVYCARGGKHQPRGIEVKINNQVVKYESCRKCEYRIGDRKR